MQILVMRHARAASTSEAGVSSDSQRPLTPRGTADASALGVLIREQNALPERVFCSPLRRTRETASALLESAKSKIPVEITDHLRPGEPTENLLATLLGSSEAERILLVGHEPDMSHLIHLWSGATVDMPAGALYCLDWADGGKSRLLWSWTPETPFTRYAT